MTMTKELTRIRILEKKGDSLVEVSMSGKLRKEDYDLFVPELDRLTKQHGKIRMLVELIDFHGWTAGALWEDTKFAARHFSDIERLALVGDSMWEKGMALFCKPFTMARVRYFDIAERDRAEAWLRESS